MKDPQQKRVYSWEGDWLDWNRSSLTLAECRATVKWACDKYGLKTPRITQHVGNEYTFFQDGRISFRHDQKNAAIALHEAAHYVCDEIFGHKIEHHSPEWMGVYLWLLEGYRVAPRTALHASAKARRIKWVQTWLVSPKRLGRRR